MPLQPGARVGPYEILEAIAVGGMGQVFKARDTRLDRLVAIKQSATEFSDRFEREARAVAALNHPNICQLYDVGPDYIVIEFLDGRPIAPVDSTRKLLDLAVQIADGIAAAHAAGIVHRDLKPDNILVTAEGRVKIVDFGIAKAIAADTTNQPTLTSLTGAGSAVGTVHYMSPEQARGLATIGPQSDQFSFGLILYELVMGRKAFERDSSAETMAAIIREEAAPLTASVPAPLRWIIDRLLAKDPAERYDSSRDLYRELKQLRDRLSDATAPISGITSATTVAPVARSRARGWLAWVAAVALAAVASGLTWALAPRGRTGEIDLSPYRFTPVSLEAATEREPAWSPDGRSIAYTAVVDGVSQLMVRELGAKTAVRLTRLSSNVTAPFWSPDGSRLFFVIMDFLGQGSLWSVSAVGGEPELVIEGATSAALHPRENRLVFARAGKLWIVDRSPVVVDKNPQPFGQSPFEGAAVVSAFSPDGAKLLVVKDGRLWVLAYPGGAARRVPLDEVVAAGANSWMPDRQHVIVAIQGGRQLQPIIAMVDTNTGALRTVHNSPAALLNPSVSPDGTRLAFSTGDGRWKLAEVTLADGRVRELATGSRVSWFPSLSPDGTRLAFANGPFNGFDILEMTLAAGGEVVSRTMAEVESVDRILIQVEWSPDGARVLMSASLPTGPRLMIAPTAGGRALPVDPDAAQSGDGVWSPDGTRIVYQRRLGDEHQLVTVRVGTSAAPVVVKRWSVEDPSRGRMPVAWSPNGQSILTRQATNLFLMTADGSSERPLPTNAGSRARARPIFSRDGREILMLRRDSVATGLVWKLFALDIASGKERVVTTVDLPRTGDDVAGLSISPDGKRLYTSFADWPFDIWMLEGFR